MNASIFPITLYINKTKTAKEEKKMSKMLHIHVSSSKKFTKVIYLCAVGFRCMHPICVWILYCVTFQLNTIFYVFSHLFHNVFLLENDLNQVICHSYDYDFTFFHVVLSFSWLCAGFWKTIGLFINSMLHQTKRVPSWVLFSFTLLLLFTFDNHQTLFIFLLFQVPYWHKEKMFVYDQKFIIMKRKTTWKRLY